MVHNGSGHGHGTASAAAGLYVLCFFAVGVLALLGFVFSIVGLVMAIKQSTPKWIGVTGIITCCLCIPSFFFPIVVAAWNASDRVPKCERVAANQDMVDVGILIQVDDEGFVTCYDNFDGEDQEPLVLDIKKPGFRTLFAKWIRNLGTQKIKRVKDENLLILEVSHAISYTETRELLDVMRDNGLSPTLKTYNPRS